MLSLLQKTVSILNSDSTLTAIVKSDNIRVGPFDTTVEKQSELTMPQINIHISSEASRTVPLNTRDTNFQLDIWSRTSQLELEVIYERVVALLNYASYDQGSNHIFWQRLSGAIDLYESDMRLWHRSCTFVAWEQ